MSRIVAAIVAVLALGLVPLAQPVDAKPPKVDCTLLVFQPTTFWTRGAWRPKSVPHGWTVEDWFWHCSGRMRPEKRGPKRPPGPWAASIRLNVNNCTYQADESWLRDPAGWRKAKIFVSPYPA
jgi:hypothetical protein